jgi:hypothetical protein
MAKLRPNANILMQSTWSAMLLIVCYMQWKLLVALTLIKNKLERQEWIYFQMFTE